MPHWPTVNARAKARKEAVPKFPYPADLVEQSERHAANRAAKEAHNAAPCARCGKERGHGDHQYTAQTLRPRCRFEETQS